MSLLCLVLVVVTPLLTMGSQTIRINLLGDIGPVIAYLICERKLSQMHRIHVSLHCALLQWSLLFAPSSHHHQTCVFVTNFVPSLFGWHYINNCIKKCASNRILPALDLQYFALNETWDISFAISKSVNSIYTIECCMSTNSFSY